MVNWEIFGAGMALIGFMIMLLILNGLLATFKIKVRVPWYIPTAVFVIGLLLVMESVGLITNINELFTIAIKNSNLAEFVLGLVVILLAVYQPIYQRIGITPSAWIRLSMFIFGVILVLDSVRILPILYYLSQLIGYATYSAATYLAAYPWLGIFIVLAVFIVITLMYIKVTRRGGVGT